MQLTARWVVAIALLSAPGAAHADGWLGMRGAYYKERSTRVLQPMIDAHLETGPQGAVDAHFLVDSITSASVAAGAATEFTELRYELGAGYTHAVTPTLRVGAHGRTSVEQDYTSNFVAARAELELFQRNTRVALALGRGRDTITNGVAVNMGGLGTPRLEERLATGLSSISLTQVLTPHLVATVTYDFIDMHGYQANIYRLVFGGTTPVPERVPDLRLRHAIFGGLRAFVPFTRTVAFVGYRYYTDDWDVVAHTPEVRLIQEIVPGLELRGRYRYHTQTAAFFFQDTYTKAEIEDPMRYVTDDEKLSAFETHTLGGQVSADLSLFGVRGTWAAARIDAVVERIWQDTAFGDAWASQVGLTVPLVY